MRILYIQGFSLKKPHENGKLFRSLFTIFIILKGKDSCHQELNVTVL